MNIITVIGARPQFIKAAAISATLAERGTLSERLLHTGQHFDDDMSDVFFRELGIPKPAWNLGLGGGMHGAMTGAQLAGIERILLDERPDAVLLYGDTNSTLAGALAAAKLQIPVAHVEAGLRSFNRAMPEEINRVLTDHVSDWLFTPTEVAAVHLRHEGIDEAQIVPVGDVMFDIALRHGARVGAAGGALGRLGLSPGSYALATVHRAENTNDPARLEVIVAALIRLAERLPVVWPLHPRTRAVLAAAGRRDELAQRLRLTDPVGYLDMVQLERHAALIATDSGGVQKEAFFHRVPCVTLRDETEWVELVDAGWNRLAPPTDADVVAAALTGAIGSHGDDVSPYGRGDAAERIVERLARDLGA